VRAKWLAARAAELLPVPYFHIVFTLPHELSSLVLQNKRLLYDLLFRTSSASLLELARDPKHLGADIGFLGVLHTWGQNLQVHPHIHYIVPAGGLAFDGSRWIDSSHRFFLPVKALSKVFRGKFCEELRELFKQDRLQFHNSLQQLASPGAFNYFLWQLGQKDWVVYAKPPFGGTEHVLNYLARYTHRVAISNHRLVALENDRIPLARLCSWRQAEGHDPFSRSVPAQISSSRAAQRPDPHPPLRLVRQPQKGNRPCTLPSVAWRGEQRRAVGNNKSATLPRMFSNHAGHRTIHRCSTLLPA